MFHISYIIDCLVIYVSSDSSEFSEFSENSSGESLFFAVALLRGVVTLHSQTKSGRSQSAPGRSIPKHGAFQELLRYASTVLVRPVRRSVRAVNPKSSVAASVVQFQLRCFIIWNLSRLSVDGLPVSEPIFSAT